MEKFLQPIRHLSAAHCELEQVDTLLGFPRWYRGLQVDSDCHPVFTNLDEIWMVVANVLDILLRLSAILAVVFIIYGGIRYIVSQGNSDQLQAAKQIITYAVIGLVLALLASTIVGFIAGRF